MNWGALLRLLAPLVSRCGGHIGPALLRERHRGLLLRLGGVPSLAGEGRRALLEEGGHAFAVVVRPAREVLKVRFVVERVVQAA